MEFELENDWGDNDGWNIDTSTSKSKKEESTTPKKRKIERKDQSDEPPKKKVKSNDPKVDTPKVVEEEESTSDQTMTKSMKRRIRRKKLEEKRKLEEEQANDKKKRSKSKKDTKSEPIDDRKDEDDKESNVKETKQKKKSANISAMKEKLKGGQFRWLNEQLYTTSSEQAMNLFTEEPELFQAYHEGFRSQVQDWPENPVDVFIRFLRKHPDLVVGDFGCGDAKIAESVSNKVHSFDLQSVNPRVTACDIANVPLKKNSIDVAIYSLSLMGTNYIEFLKEAYRVLKPKGQLKIAEVKSRFTNINGFINTLKTIGFDFVSKEDSNTMFILFDFVKSTKKPNPKKLKSYELKPCLYKRR